MNNKGRKFNIGDKVIRINKEFYNNSYHNGLANKNDNMFIRSSIVSDVYSYGGGHWKYFTQISINIKWILLGILVIIKPGKFVKKMELRQIRIVLIKKYGIMQKKMQIKYERLLINARRNFTKNVKLHAKKKQKNQKQKYYMRKNAWQH